MKVLFFIKIRQGRLLLASRQVYCFKQASPTDAETVFLLYIYYRRNTVARGQDFFTI